MPKPIKTSEQLARAGPYESEVSDTTVAFATCKAVPEIVDEVGDSAKLKVHFGSLQIENGQTISPDELMDEPSIEISPEGTYTLMVVDPDAPAPTHPHLRSWLHWLVINIPSNDVARGEELCSYEPPSPARGRHRCLWLLFRQEKRVTGRKPESRKGFQVKEWASQHGLGKPANGLFFWVTAPDAEK